MGEGLSRKSLKDKQNSQWIPWNAPVRLGMLNTLSGVKSWAEGMVLTLAMFQVPFGWHILHYLNRGILNQECRLEEQFFFVRNNVQLFKKIL